MSLLERTIRDDQRSTLSDSPLDRSATTRPGVSPAAIVTVIAVAAGVGTIGGDLIRTVIGAAAAAVLGAAHALRPELLRTRYPIAQAFLLGAIVGVGVALGTTGSASTTIAQAVVVWLAAAAMTGSVDSDRRTLIRLVAAAATVAAVTGAVVTGRPQMMIVALALPLALTMFWTIGARGRIEVGVSPRWLGAAATFGIIATVLAASSVDSDVSVTAGLGTAVVSALIALGAPTTRRSPNVAPIVGLGVLCFVAGLGAGAVPLVALALVASTSPDRQLRSTRRDPDTRSGPAIKMVAALTVIGFLVRLFPGRGLWLDETTSVFQSKMGLFEMIAFIYETDNHPPLHHIVMWFGIRVIGDSELALRLPMMAMGAALIPLLYMIGREFFSRRVGLYAAAFGTVAPLAVWYGQEARMYSQFMLLAAISTYALGRILHTTDAHSGPRRYWVIFTLASVALVYTQYFAVLHVGATLLVMVIETFRRRHAGQWRPLAKSLVATIVAQTLLIAPMVPFAVMQAARNQDEGFGLNASTGVANAADVVPPPGIYGFLTNLQWTFFGYLPDQVSVRLVALWPVGLLIALLLLGTQRRTSNRILLTIAGIPMLIIFGASFLASQSRSLAEVRYFSGAVPVLFVMLAAGIAAIVRTVRLQQVIVGATLALMLVSLGVQQFDDENPRLYQYRDAIEQVRSEAQPGDRVLYAPEYFDYTVDYYPTTIPTAALADGVPTPVEVPAGSSIFLIQAESFADDSDAQADVALQTLSAEGFAVDDEWDFAQIRVVKLSPPADNGTTTNDIEAETTS